MVTEDTLCLTPEGWRSFRQVRPGEVVYAFDMNNRLIN